MAAASGTGSAACLAADERAWLDPLVAEALAATLVGGVDSQAPSNPASATLPDGAPITRGVGTARLGAPATRGVGTPRLDGAPRTRGAGTERLDLDAEALAALPVALARRVVREAARRAGDPVPDAAATDRILGLPAD